MNDETRLDELLAARATQGLSDLDEAALALLLEGEPAFDVDHYDSVATALDLALNAEVYADPDPLPSHLSAKLGDLAEQFTRGVDLSLIGTTAPSEQAVPEAPRSTVPAAPRSSLWGVAGWLVAAAAIALMATGLFDAPTAMPGAPDLAAVEAFVVANPDALVIDWAPGGDATGARAGGRVVWSQAAQAGFMVLDDLAVNDVSVEQYQLWIFDGDRANPVDGGVFDADGSASQVVAIDAKLDVIDPTLFAVTVERPGGVVVSSKERISIAADPANAR